MKSADEPRAFSLSVFADYFQVFIEDEGNEVDDPGDGWDQLTRSQRVLMLPGMLNIATARNMTVPITIVIANSQPQEDYSSWDHIVEAGLDIRSGHLIVSSPIGTQVEQIDVTPGQYVARIAFEGLGSLSLDGLKGSDHYRVQLWPGTLDSVTVIKQYSTRESGTRGFST